MKLPSAHLGASSCLQTWYGMGECFIGVMLQLGDGAPV